MYTFFGFGVLLVVTIAAYGIYWYTNLEDVPFPGIERKQFVKLVDDEMLQNLGEKAVQDIAKDLKTLPPSHSISRKVNEIGSHIIKASNNPILQSAPIKFLILDAPNIVGCATAPDRTIIFWSGMFYAMKRNDNYLAVILAHELAHLAARHHKEQMSSTWSWFRRRVDFQHSQLIEREADHIGIILMAKACYNPVAVVDVWKLLETVIPDQNSMGYENALHTHPPHKERAENAINWMPEANEALKNCLKKPYRLF
uniref:Peptidase M48 domain-containing protein n=1 Tax=Arcella intermedia TaxID=1963864 RepID=A0A6B2LD57_9EUKA